MVGDPAHSRATIIAVDGPAGAGKGTLGRRLADHFGFAYLDTGLLYRIAAAKALQAGTADPARFIAAASSIVAADLERRDLRTEEVAQAASRAAAIPAVRQALLAFQRSFAHTPPHGASGAVLDGRDIGTVVCPEAAIKLFIIARVEIRAARRVKELRATGHEAIHAHVLRDMRERDARDSQRSVSPLRPAEDAFTIDTSDLSRDAVFAAAVAHIGSRVGRWR